jgi:hypothetical protein
MATAVDRLGARWEHIYPGLLGVAGAVAGYLYGPAVLAHMDSRHWDIENLFVAVFTLGTVAAGFGFAIYTFLLTTESGFIGRAKNSIYYRALLTFVLVATILSAVLSIASIPGMIIKSVPAAYSLHALYIAIWTGILAWTGASLFRAGHLFAIFAREHH